MRPPAVTRTCGTAGRTRCARQGLATAGAAWAEGASHGARKGRSGTCGRVLSRLLEPLSRQQEQILAATVTSWKWRLTSCSLSLQKGSEDIWFYRNGLSECCHGSPLRGGGAGLSRAHLSRSSAEPLGFCPGCCSSGHPRCRAVPCRHSQPAPHALPLASQQRSHSTPSACACMCACMCVHVCVHLCVHCECVCARPGSPRSHASFFNLWELDVGE